MIPKLWCFLFGHKRWERIKKRIVQETEFELIYEWERVDYRVCPRCGTTIK